MIRRTPMNRGFTILEMTVSISVLTIMMGGFFVLASTGTKLAGESATSVESQKAAHRSLVGVFDSLNETAMSSVDTTSRVFQYGVSSSYRSDRFQISGGQLRQCTSPLCRFHTREDLSIKRDHYWCGSEFRSPLFPTVMRGKIWPEEAETCPLDAAYTTTTTTMDVVKFMTARDATGDFVTSSGASAGPRWGGLVFLAPGPGADGLPELREYRIYASDLMEGTVTYSQGYNHFPATSPTMVHLLDFGTDGTINGVRDNKVPASPTISDASIEAFYTGTSGGRRTVTFYKSLYGPNGGYPQRLFHLTIYLDNGETNWQVRHIESLLVNWTAQRNFVREPKTLVPNLTEFAASTQVSNPWSATNPDGVQESSVVRLVVGTSQPNFDQGEKTWKHSVDVVTVTPKN